MKLKVFLTLFVLVSAISIAVIFPGLTHAQTATSSSNTTSDFSNLDQGVPNNLHTYTQSVLIETLSSVACVLTGFDPAHPNTPCLGVDQKTNKLGYVEQSGGFLGMVGGAIAMTYNMPVSTHDYAVYTVNNFGFAKKTYAQNSADQTAGFVGLAPLIDIWRTFRNFVYLLFTIIFIVIGIGIVLRIPVQDKAVMSIQNQIPRVIITLILVTLSFAIAGLLIDLMYVSIYAVYALFSNIPGMNLPSLNPTSAFGHTPFEAVNGITGLGQIAGGTSSVIGGFLGTVFSGTIGKVIAGFVLSLVGSSIGGGLGSFAGPLGGLAGEGIGIISGIALGALAGGKIIGLVGEIIAFVVIAVALVIALVKLWFNLIKAYIYILIDVIFAPLWIGAGAIPKSSWGFTSWLRHIISNLLVFPLTFVFFMLAYVFINVFSTTNQSSYFVPPFVGNLGSYKVLGPVIAFGIILMTGEIPAIIKDMLKTPDVKYTQSLGKGVSGGVSTIQQFGKPIAGRFWKYDEHGVPKGIINSRLLKGTNRWFKNARWARFATGVKEAPNPTEVTDGQRHGPEPGGR